MASYKPIPSFDEAALTAFWKRVSGHGLTHLCWNWTGSKKSGYGIFRGYRTHRIAYVLRHGQIPEGLTLDHLCRNTLCCNPRHLEAVESKVNVLRGEGAMARHARKTHCPQGHEYTAENTRLLRGRSRECRQCAKDRRAAKKQWHSGKKK